jgi:tRNA(Arg) A34 adenosine deaminase TadA
VLTFVAEEVEFTRSEEYFPQGLKPGRFSYSFGTTEVVPCHNKIRLGHFLNPTMMNSPNPEFLRRAIALATENVTSGRGGPFGAVIVREGKIVGEGANSVTATNDPTAHAEVNAIRAAAKALGTFTLAGCELYTSCEPCPMCLAASYWARLDAVYYGASAADAARAGFDDAFLYAEFKRDQAERTLPAAQMLGDEAWASFAAWIVSDIKIAY